MPALEPKSSAGDLSTNPGSVSEKAQKLKPSRSSFLPLWIARPLKSPKAWKVLLRCWVAVFASFVILLPNASLRTVGTTSFFAILASLFLPPYLPVQLTIFLLSTLMVGLVFGWGIGIAAMRAANAVRDQAHIQAVGAQIQASIQSNPVFQANPTLAKTVAVFAGDFLDIRASAMHGAFMIIGNLIFGLIRAYAPKLLFMSIFGTIAVDIFCTIGPLFPTARYNLLNSTAISISCYMAIAILTTIFIFPETMSHATMDTLAEQLSRLQTLVEMQDDVLTSPAEELKPESPILAKFTALRVAVITTQRQILATSGMLSLEFSWGRWNGDDLRDLEAPMIALITRVGTLLNFDRIASTTRLAPPSPPTSSSSSTSLHPSTRWWHETHLLRTIHTRHARLEAEHGVRPDDIIPLLDGVTKEVREASVKALACVRGYIVHVNRTRWKRGSNGAVAEEGEKVRAEMDEAEMRLAKALAEFEEVRRGQLLEPFIPLLAAFAAAKDEGGKKGGDIGSLPLRSLFVAYVFAGNIVAIAEAVQGLIASVQTIDDKRPKRARLWAPTGLRSAWKTVVARGDKADGVFGDDVNASVGTELKMGGVMEEKAYRRDPDSRPPTNLFQKVMNFIHRGYLWTKTAEAIFTFKYVFISVALWIPAVIRSSAHFYYVEKGIWALIMAQTTLNIYAADQIFNYVTRLGGTLLGLALGLIAWYAGNGNGNGNPYGAAAAFGVVVFPLVFLRVFSPEPYLPGNVMTCATFALVAGYSWIDGHTIQFATPGIGWSVAWKRWALVVVGSAASFIVMMFPPTSGRKAVRIRNAASISALSNTYGFLISAWISRRDDDDSNVVDATNRGLQSAWPAAFRSQLLALGDGLHTIRELTELAKWEGSIRGKWPAKEYMRLVDVQVEMISVLAQLATSLSHLESTRQAPYLRTSNVLNPNFIADVMAVFSLISHSLRTGEPMHQVTPTNLLDRLLYHDSHGHVRPLNSPTNQPGSTAQDMIEAMKSSSYMYYASSIVGVYQLLRYLDELHLITKDLCGEIPLNGFADWRSRYDRGHEAV
ncbi:hypothetical protein R3P38DRAFT_2729656 [Favolaschia claudopus]|uniref:ER transporter 6TM N-terminal domain-containing protein n=1 Tax=Favolaschia claudopus TaxID=2862362 RepID=A0AAW0A9D7_9AGAR